MLCALSLVGLNTELDQSKLLVNFVQLESPLLHEQLQRMYISTLSLGPVLKTLIIPLRIDVS